MQIAKVSVELIHQKDLLEQCVTKEDFQTAASIKATINTIEDEKVRVDVGFLGGSLVAFGWFLGGSLVAFGWFLGGFWVVFGGFFGGFWGVLWWLLGDSLVAFGWFLGVLSFFWEDWMGFWKGRGCEKNETSRDTPE